MARGVSRGNLQNQGDKKNPRCPRSRGPGSRRERSAAKRLSQNPKEGCQDKACSFQDIYS